jgi:hypothetical protein
MSAPMADTAEIPRQRPADAPPTVHGAAVQGLHSVGAPVPSVAPATAHRVAPGAPPVAWVPRHPAPALTLAVPPIAASPSPLGRAALRAERLAARRERRLYACLGLGAVAGTLAATVVVLDVFH